MQKTCMASKTTDVHVCKMKCNTHAYAYVVRVCHEMILLVTSGALNFIIYTRKNILFGGMVTDILGQPRHIVFVATCRHVPNIQA